MGKNCSDDGSCVVPISCNQIAIFQNLGILFIGKKEVPDILYRRKLIESKTENFEIIDADYQENGDGLRQKLLEEAEKDAREMNLNSVRICFEAFWLKNDQLYPICPKIYSRPIANQKSPDSGELKISRINRFFGSVIGGEEIYLLCEKVNKKEIRIRFFEIDNEGCQRWEAFGEFTETDVHHQVAIVFRTPPYRDQSITEPVQVYLQLFRLRDREYSEPKIFIYRPKMDHSQNEWTIHQDMITLDSSNNEDNQSLDQQRKCQPPYSSSSLNQIEKSMHRQQEVETSTMASIIISQPALIVKQKSIESNLIDCLFHTKVLASSMDQSNIEFKAPSELNQQNYLHVYNKQQQKDEKIDFEQSNCIWNLSSDQNHHLCEHQHQNSNQSDLHIEGYSNHDDHSIRSSVSSLNTSQSRLSFYPSNNLHRHHQQAIA
ncbi:geranylgeranyl pyrophosphate synthase [Sarcoptes scabiei]|nr:geranylgeranyl pyrophosphate synthase [Sarcoptes scabiei]